MRFLSCVGGVYLPGTDEDGILCAGGITVGAGGGQRSPYVQFLPLRPTPGACRTLGNLAQVASNLMPLNTGSELLLCEYSDFPRFH